MNPRTWALLALFLLATACATDGAPSLKTDPSDTGARLALVAESRSLQVIRSPIRRAPVEVSKAEYHTAMVQLARQLRHTLPPRAASQLAIIPWGSPGQPDERAELVREYYQWCEQRGTPGDCLALLTDGLYLSEGPKSPWPSLWPHGASGTAPPLSSTRCWTRSSFKSPW